MPSLTTQTISRSVALLLSISMTAPLWAGESFQSSLQRSLLLNVGQNKQAINDAVSSLSDKGYSSITTGNDKYATSWSIGYRQPVTKRWSVDLAYLDQGETNPTLQATAPAGTSDAQAAQDIAEALPKRGQGINVTGVYHHTLWAGLTAQAGAGVYLWKSTQEATVNGTSHTTKDKGVSPLVQLGMSYALNKKVSIDAKWQETFMPDDDISQLMLGVAIGL